MSFLSTMDIATSALTAQRFRMDMISQNIANIDTTRAQDGQPYQRRLTVFQEKALNFKTTLEREAYLRSNTRAGSGIQRNSRNNAVGGGVRVAEVIRDESDFVPVYNPSHPDANEDGYVMMPNVDRAEETIDLMAATHSYNANITTVNIIKAMAMKAAELTR
ncbi:flagellar basal body rod protein FlgC [Ruminococcaceae bacterium OttesenSCG-928-D13]|nr:flagellar basal body rod protein FlgC [Ruminococcaceae bacterium OttesenSCG-928-D13]